MRLRICHSDLFQRELGLAEAFCKRNVHVANPVEMLFHFALGIEQIHVHALGKKFGCLHCVTQQQETHDGACRHFVEMACTNVQYLLAIGLLDGSGTYRAKFTLLITGNDGTVDTIEQVIESRY